jgi:predicted nuclease of predicted toxin-antitoxin system
MKLLFDENLSPQLVRLLHDLFPNSIHVRDVGLKAADDPVVWKYAQDNGLIICTKDCLRGHFVAIEAFAADEHASFLALS